MRRARLLAALAVPLGFLVGHTVAYALAPPDDAVAECAAHGYLDGLTGAAVPLAVLAVALAVVRGARRRPFTLRAGPVVAQLVGAYLAVELVEHAHVGVPPLDVLTERTTLVGVLLQVAVGLLLVRLLRAGHRLGARLAPCADGPARRPAVLLPAPVVPARRCLVLAGGVSWRGPPRPAAA